MKSIALIALALAGSVFAADNVLPGNLPPGPAPTGNNAYGVTPPSGKPIEDKAGYLSWKTLAKVEPVPQGATFIPKFDPAISALNNKTIKLQGFMLPLGMGEGQKHFVLTATPPTCSYCLPGGPDQVVEIKSTQPVKFSYEPLQLTGKFVVLKDDPMGMYYRLEDAKLIN
ncbi:DUF3299 domain-containing protein [Parachitinimonas caeni]|uniref:DUF3299 domain-containing protein n=1 Tax=Parachitinimonas caeni TaxID=3031301 RepID=A0ABT7E1P5_9NEIS|nr:DUF3299 domain-containing protein [Parachitinimonas caeni]MDK2125335.1 DUF3299 domain-containing protein [Parachitinimonas caeni]